MVSMHVVLDIDGVLACRSASGIERASFFKKKGAILTAIKTHYIFPGVIELIKLLHQTEGVRVSFFSSGAKERNDIFVDCLLKLALDEKKYKSIKQDVRILSKKDLTIRDDDDGRNLNALYNIKGGVKQKDLREILQGEELLENVVLIEDDSSYVASGQVENLLHVRESCDDSFSKMSSWPAIYDLDGYKFLRCALITPTRLKAYKTGVDQGSQILIIKKEDGLEAAFLNKESNKYETKKIPEEGNEALISKLKMLDDKEIIQDKETIQEICHLIDSFNGKTKKINRQANRVYYVVGLLFAALEKSRLEGIPITKSLFSMQFKQKKDLRSYKPKFLKLQRREELYALGLEKLRQINRDLQFITLQNYFEVVNLPITDEERVELEAAIENETGGCCIS